MLDEFPQLGHMAPIESTIDLGRQYGLRLWMFVQSISHIEEHYGDARGFLSRCALQIYMNPQHIDGTTEYLSQSLGTRESILDGQTVRMVEPGELAGPEFLDQMIVMGQGIRPVKLAKQWAWKNPEMLKWMEIPPPKLA